MVQPLAGFDPLFVAQQVQPTVNQISELDLDVLFTHMMRVEPFFDEARQVLLPDYFDPGSESHFAMLWEALCQARDAYQHFVGPTLQYMISTALANDPGLVTPEGTEALLADGSKGVIASAWLQGEETLQVELARTILQRFLNERTILRPMQNLLKQRFNDQVLSNVPELLEVFQNQHRRIAAMAQQPFSEMAPARGAVFEQAFVFHPTGLEFVDRAVGGQREGDCNGLVGPTGGGKSTMAIHLAVASARNCYRESCLANSQPMMTAIFSYEESEKLIQPRIWSAAFRIRRKKLETMASWDELTTGDNLEEYELHMAGPGVQPESERDRWDAGRVWLNKHLRLFDMSGSQKYPNAGRGYIQEISSVLDRTTNESGVGMRTVFLDWAGLIVDRHMENINEPPDKKRYYLQQMGDLVKRLVAEKFGCTVWIVHQLKAAAGTYSPTKLIHHSDAMDSKAFATPLAAVGCLGVEDPRTKQRLLNWSKVRFSEVMMPPVTLGIHPMFAEMQDNSHRYAVDQAGHRFIDREMLDQIEGGEAREQRRAMTGPRGGVRGYAPGRLPPDVDGLPM